MHPAMWQSAPAWWAWHPNELKSDWYNIFSLFEKMINMKAFLVLSCGTKMQGGAVLSVITKG